MKLMCEQLYLWEKEEKSRIDLHNVHHCDDDSLNRWSRLDSVFVHNHQTHANEKKKNHMRGNRKISLSSPEKMIGNS